MRNAGLEETQAGIKIARRDINNLRYADKTTLMAESEGELKSLWIKVKQESKKVALMLNIQKTKIMASSPITSWQTEEETMETVTDFIFLAPKSLQMVITAMRDGMGREVGGGFRMGNTCTPMVDSYQCMAKSYNIVK